MATARHPTEAGERDGGEAGLESRFEARVDGARVVYADVGEGEPVLFLHGYPQSRLSWRHAFAAVARTHRAIAPDWIGWGESERTLGLRFGYDAEVERIGRFLDALGVGRASLVLHDYGGHLGLGFAARHPERVARLAVLNSRAHRTFPPAPWLLFGAIGVAARTPFLSSVLERAPLAGIHRALLAPHRRRGCFDEALVERWLAWMATPDGRKWFVRFWQDYALREPAGVLEGLRAVRAPVAVVWGDRDPYCPPRIAEELAEIFPDATLEWVRGAGHFVVEERPAEVVPAIERLLARPVA